MIHRPKLDLQNSYENVTLDDDIIYDWILPKLPAKSLLRFKCVSKSWLTLISSPEFIRQHHKLALSRDDDRVLVLTGPGRCWWMFGLNDGPGTMPSVCRYYELPSTAMGMRVVAVCDGFFLVGCGNTQLEQLVLLNPSTCTFRVLPFIRVPRDTLGVLYGLCYDEGTQDFKVVRFCYLNDFGRESMVFSMTTNTWKLIEPERCSDDISWSDNCVLINGRFLNICYNALDDLMHIPWDTYFGWVRKVRIGCFDMMAEQWAPDVGLPITLNTEIHAISGRKRPFHASVYHLDGCLSLMVKDSGNCNHTVWVMKEYGVQSSWVKLMSIPVFPPQLSPVFSKWAYHPVAFLKGSKQEILCKKMNSSKLFWYNCLEKESTRAEFNGVPEYTSSMAYVIKGSLINIPGGQKIR